jgi:hypothetical protein
MPVPAAAASGDPSRQASLRCLPDQAQPCLLPSQLKQRDAAGAAGVLAERGVVADTSQLDLYRRVALEVLAAPRDQLDPAAEAAAAQYLSK